MSSCFLSFQAIFHTQFGEELYAVGNRPSLGAWDCRNALRLFTTKHDYPSWRACHKITLPYLLQPLSIGYRLEFKICVKEGHTFKRWENFPSDRNRIYMTDCRYVKLKVIENSLELVAERKHRTVSSDEMVALELHPAHKYDSRNV